MDFSTGGFLAGARPAGVWFHFSVISKKEAGPGSGRNTFPAHHHVRQVSEAGFKSLVVFRAGVDGLGVESAGRIFYPRLGNAITDNKLGQEPSYKERVRTAGLKISEAAPRVLSNALLNAF